MNLLKFIDQINWGIWNNIICDVETLYDKTGKVVVENGKSVVKFDAIKMY